LIVAKEKAEESDRLKTSFLANMSHEIRTPLNSILGFSDLLANDDHPEELKKEYYEIVHSSGEHLLSIINDILDTSQIESGQVALSLSEFSVHQLVLEIQKEHSYRASAKGIELKIAENIPGEHLLIRNDRTRVKQVLTNLVGNAVKFTSSGYVEIGLKPEAKGIQFHVTDTGIGIDQQNQDLIFERFRQVESAQTRKYGGNGLGLSITKSLANILGGEIRLESEVGKGSVFYFTIPYKPVNQPHNLE